RNKKITISDGRVVPDGNEEYLLYQTLVGIWPWTLEAKDRAEIVKRVQDYMTKAVHEAKVNLSWVSQNPEYVEALRKFISDILMGRPRGRNFISFLEELVASIGLFGAMNSLAQTTLKLMAPGNPDISQGTELWDFSLVDPDNRRPVDFALRERMLTELDRKAEAGNLPALCAELLENYQDGRVKLWTTMQALRLRRDRRDLFHPGRYL